MYTYIGTVGRVYRGKQEVALAANPAVFGIFRGLRLSLSPIPFERNVALFTAVNVTAPVTDSATWFGDCDNIVDRTHDSEA